MDADEYAAIHGLNGNGRCSGDCHIADQTRFSAWASWQMIPPDVRRRGQFIELTNRAGGVVAVVGPFHGRSWERLVLLVQRVAEQMGAENWQIIQ